MYPDTTNVNPFNIINLRDICLLDKIELFININEVDIK